MSLVGRLLVCRTTASCALPFVRGQQLIGRKRLRKQRSWISSQASVRDDGALPPHPLWILGSGSIGLFLAAAIRARHPCYPLSLLLRDHHAENLRISQSSTHVKDHNFPPSDAPYIEISLEQPALGRQTLVPVPAQLLQTFRRKSPPTIKTLVLATKAFQAVPALQGIRSQLANDARIVVLCNGGLAVRDELQRAFSENHWQIELASITHGAYQNNEIKSNTASYHVVHVGVGRIYLVPRDNTDISNDPLSPTMLNQAGLNCQVLASHQEMESILWYKLAANCVCNPLTAIHQCTNGAMKDIVVAPPYSLDELIANVVQEVCQVQRAVTTSSSGSADASQQVLDPHRVTAFVHQVIADNLDNRTSMQQDVFHQRPTEIDFLNGYITRTGAQYGIESPTNRHLQEEVVELETKYGSTSP